jgi:hypothetical protein
MEAALVMLKSRAATSLAGLSRSLNFSKQTVPASELSTVGRATP